jgi:raffinose/stachyose/melibiose transport system permease protein
MTLITERYRSRTTRITLHVGLIVFAALWLIPLVVVMMTAIRSEGDLMSGGVFSIPRELSLANFADAWEIGGFSIYFKNSVIVTLTKVPLGILIASLAAYALTKLRIRYSSALFVFFLLGLAIPAHVVLLPLFVMLREIGVLDTLWALYPPYIAFGLAFEILILRGFFSLIPDELIDAARVDGASEFRIYWNIMLPLSLPVLATVFIIDALSTWNEFLIALVMLTSEEVQTIPLGLLNFQGQFSSNHTALMAGVAIAILPILVLYIALQRYVIYGLTGGALKE